MEAKIIFLSFMMVLDYSFGMLPTQKFSTLM